MKTHFDNIKTFLIYSFGSISNYIIPVLLLPILTRLLSKEDYGVVSTFSSIIGVTTVFVSFSATGAVSRAFFESKTNNINFPLFLGNAFIANTLLSSIILLPFLTISYFKIIDLPSELFGIIPLLLLLQTFKSYKPKLWILQEKPISNSLFEVASNATSLVLSLFIIFFIINDWRGRVFGIIISNVVFCLIAVYYLLREDGLILTFKKAYFIDIFKYGSPLIFHGIGISFVGLLDKLIVNNQLGLEKAGLYGVAATITGVLSIIILPLEKTITPKIYNLLSNYSQNNAKQMFKLFIVNIFYLFLGSVIFYTTITFIGPLIIGDEFIQSLKYLPILLIGKIFWGLYRFSVKPLFFSKKTYLISISTLSSGVLGFFFTFFFTKYFGMYGAAWGFVLSNFFAFIFVFLFSQKLYPFRLSF